MTKHSSTATRGRTWQPPQLVVTADFPGAQAPAELLRQGQKAEEAYDFDLAKTLYAAALRQASPQDALARTTGYAQFLVERYGQFQEVAAWLDDPAFAPPAGLPGRALALLLVRAGEEIGHPRTAELQEQLAESGELTAVAATAQRWHSQGRSTQALAMLEKYAGSLPKGTPAQVLLGELRAAQTTACQKALEPAQTCLQQGDWLGAQAVLGAAQVQWQRHPHWQAVHQQAEQAKHKHEADQLRVLMQNWLRDGDLAAAERQGKVLLQSPAATDADHKQVLEIAHKRKQASLKEYLGQLAADPILALAHAAQLCAHDEELTKTLREAVRPHAPLWAAVEEAGTLGLDSLVKHLEPLRTLGQIHVALAQQGQTGPSLAAVKALPTAWQKFGSVQRWRVVEKARQDAEKQQAEEGVIATLRTLLDDEQLDEAARVLHQWMAIQPLLSAELKALRNELTGLRGFVERRTKLRNDFDLHLESDNFFGARAVLSELKHLVTMNERQLRTQTLETRSAPALRGKGQPPGLQKLAEAPIAVGLGLDRLVLVQDRMWLTVNLSTGGLQPFALPEAWPVQVHAWTRIAAVGHRLRLVGLSGSRLVVIEQVPGQAPEVVGATELRNLLRGDDVLAGAALQPAAQSWWLLGQSSKRPLSSTWVRIEPQSLEVLEYRRTQPAWEFLCGIDGAKKDLGMFAVYPRLRQGVAVGVVDDSGALETACSDNDLEEVVAGIRNAQAWPEQDRIYASFSTRDPFGLDARVQDPASLLVLRSGKISFISSELRKRFCPQDKVAIDRAWTLDAAQGRLWFAALPHEGHGTEALILGVDAKTLRPDKPVIVQGVSQILALMPTPEGAIALVKLTAGGWGLTRATVQAPGQPVGLTTTRLPL